MTVFYWSTAGPGPPPGNPDKRSRWEGSDCSLGMTSLMTMSLTNQVPVTGPSCPAESADYSKEREREKKRQEWLSLWLFHLCTRRYNSSYVFSFLYVSGKCMCHLRHYKGSVAQHVRGHQQGSDCRQIRFIITETNVERELNNTLFTSLT